MIFIYSSFFLITNSTACTYNFLSISCLSYKNKVADPSLVSLKFKQDYLILLRNSIKLTA